MPAYEPRWLTRPMLLAIQPGSVRDRHQAIVESALAAPRRLHDRDPAADLATLAAAYATALAQTHGFMDGSKRAAFLAAYVFLGLNGYDVDATESEAASVFESLASRVMSQAEVAEWLYGVMTRPSQSGCAKVRQNEHAAAELLAHRARPKL